MILKLNPVLFNKAERDKLMSDKHCVGRNKREMCIHVSYASSDTWYFITPTQRQVKLAATQEKEKGGGREGEGKSEGEKEGEREKWGEVIERERETVRGREKRERERD